MTIKCSKHSLLAMIGIALVAVIHTPAALSDQQTLQPPTPYSASYQARAMGMRTEAFRELKRLPDGSYQLQHGLHLRALGATLVRVNESSQFEWQDHGVVPLRYEFQQSGVRRRDEVILFDWAAGQATLHRDGNTRQDTLSHGMLDALSASAQASALLAQLAQQRDFSAGNLRLSYTLMAINMIDEHEFEIEGTEVIETGIGPLNTVRLKRIRDADSKRSTTLWLAIDHEYTLARLQQIEGGTSTELLLQSLQFNPTD